MENVQNLDCLGRTETVVDYDSPAVSFRTPSPNCSAGAAALGGDDSVMMVSRIPVTTRNATPSPAWAIQ
ncbi:MAG TPA: hypothetical protein VMR62_30640 [Bryobacteraceae bacterium]|nr:hypothetical protein [Bryobacteraceae bacterium]